MLCGQLWIDPQIQSSKYPSAAAVALGDLASFARAADPHSRMFLAEKRRDSQIFCHKVALSNGIMSQSEWAIYNKSPVVDKPRGRIERKL